MAELFNVAENNITYHLQNIFKSGELNKDSVTQKIRVTASDGKKYNTNFYSLDANNCKLAIELIQKKLLVLEYGQQIH